VQVVALAGEDRVLALDDLDVQVAGRAAARADLALAGQPDPHAVLDAGRHLDGQRPPGADPPVTAALAARVLDDRAEAAAARAGAGRHHLAEERALHLLHLAAALAGVARRRVGAGGGALAGARRADDRGLEGQLALGAEDRVRQLALDADQRVGALAHPAARTAGAATAEEGVHDVAEPAEALRERVAGAALAGRQRIAAQVDDLPLLRVGQDLVGGGHRLEPLLRLRVGVDVGVQLPRELAVGLLQLVVARVTGDAEDAVVVRHRLRHPPAARRRSGRPPARS
jgi:hypothetical protein